MKPMLNGLQYTSSCNGRMMIREGKPTCTRHFLRLWIKKIHCQIHKSPLLNHILSQLIPYSHLLNLSMWHASPSLSRRRGPWSKSHTGALLWLSHSSYLKISNVFIAFLHTTFILTWQLDFWSWQSLLLQYHYYVLIISWNLLFPTTDTPHTVNQ
jgi:hypothetical protein